MPRGMEAEGYLLFIPPDPIKSRFVMLDEATKTFHDVDLETALLGNPASWKQTGVSPSILGNELAIVFPTPLGDSQKAELEGHDYDPNFSVGRLVSVDRHEGNKVYGKIIAKVNVKPLNQNAMSWEGLTNMKGAVLAEEMRNGLCGRLWGLPNATQGFVTSREILDKMPRKWHVDPVALNYELDKMFAAGQHVRKGEIAWHLRSS